MKICKVCGKEITESGRRSYCSDKCAREGNRINARGYATPDFDIEKPVKCLHCGKEFVRKQRHQKYCCWQCKEADSSITRYTDRYITNFAMNHDFELKNKDKILRAKKMLFKGGNMRRCPCDANNPNRYCGSDLCLSDIIYKGHCHCNLFHAKKTLQDYENGL
jgi:endogenous inhibitor of DNA gyrase (YacG/DUF329 family)